MNYQFPTPSDMLRKLECDAKQRGASTTGRWVGVVSIAGVIVYAYRFTSKSRARAWARKTAAVSRMWTASVRRYRRDLWVARSPWDVRLLVLAPSRVRAGL